MIKQIIDRIVYMDEEKVFIETLKPFEGKKWSQKHESLENLKARIRTFLEISHKNECAYCGHVIYGKGFIEHIAPKGENNHPEFMFTESNLALSCPYCNGFDGKGRINTVSVKKQNYDECEFIIVHPYFDNPNDHFKWIDNNDKILIQSKTVKGEKSIEIFNLADPKQAELRVRDINLRNLILNQTDEVLVQNAIESK